MFLMTFIHVPTNSLYYRYGSFEGWRMVQSMFLLEGSKDFALDAVGSMLKEWLEQIFVLELFALFTYYFSVFMMQV